MTYCVALFLKKLLTHYKYVLITCYVLYKASHQVYCQKLINMKKSNGKLILYGAGGIILLLLMLVINPFGYNDLGYREVVETPTGQINS